MHCPVCTSKETRLLDEKHQGYIEGMFFKILECSRCDASFIVRRNIPAKLYEIVYSNEKTPGYDRYFKVAREVEKKRNPLKFLSRFEASYFPVREYVKGKGKLRILEVGCGFGYLTYALRRAGHDAEGIDISKKAIAFARKHYGTHFHVARFETFRKKKKYDLIFANELIEHLPDPRAFLKSCLSLLAKRGVILITTPNKGHTKKLGVWATDLPPVHMTLFSRKSFRVFARQHNLRVQFSELRQYASTQENRLVRILLRSEFAEVYPVIMKNGTINPKITNRSSSVFRQTLGWFLITFAPIRVVCNLLVPPEKEHYTLAVLLSRK